MTAEETGLRDWLALTLIPGLGPRLTAALLEQFGSPAAIRNADRDALMSVPGIGSKLADEFARTLRTADVDAELDRMARHGVQAIACNTLEYPKLLATIFDPPSVLYRRGTYIEADTNAVALIGSRVCTSYGRRTATKLAAELVRAGFTVISGLAYGIDVEAHKGALAAGGRTIAVLAGGLSKIYPKEHTRLADEVAASGCLISETPMAMNPQAGMFHARNRIISGLSRAVVVVEANERSGTLITVSHAAEQGREVFAVPGNVDCPASAGTLAMIRNGAKLIRGIDDLLEDLTGLAPLIERRPDMESGSPIAVATTSGPPDGLNDQEMRIWQSLDEPKFADQLVHELGLQVSELTRLLTTLELRRVVRRLPGNKYERS